MGWPRWSGDAVALQALDAIDRITNPPLILMCQQPLDGGLAIRIDFSGCETPLVGTAVTGAVVCVGPAKPHIETASARRSAALE